MSPGKWAVGAGCFYELLALPERSPFPTITNIVTTVRRHPRLKWAAWFWVGVWAAHFLSD